MAQDLRLFSCSRYSLWILVLLSIAFLSPVRAEIPQTGRYMREALDPKVKALIEEVRASVPAAMEKDNVAGLALTLVDEKGIIWTEGFGYADVDKKNPATPDTLFPVSDLSRLINATAVMLAVQDGLVKLDEPIATYVPNFRVNSRYEEHPEQKITLRHLLNCTAGIPNAASVGNILEPASAASFEDHVKSISGSWLAYPVGGGFLSSSASFDIAAYVAAAAADKPYNDYLHDRLFKLLGMVDATADYKTIASNLQRAIGNMVGTSKLPVLGVGNIYSSARDIGRLLQLHINRGIVDGRRIVDEALIDIIHAPVGIINAQAKVYSGQGVIVDKRHPERTETILWNNSWAAFGFMSFLHWYPEYGIGMVVFTNKQPNSVYANLCLNLTDRLIKGKIIPKHFPRPDPDYGGGVQPWQGWAKHKPTPYKSEWRKYCGTHNLKVSGYSLKWWLYVAIYIIGRDDYTPRIHVREKDGFLCVTESKVIEEFKPRSVNEKLQEVKPGVFANRNGDTLDYTGQFPTWYNFRLEQK
jgi:CubicO group peptidase (beta-lactamase class C family)